VTAAEAGTAVVETVADGDPQRDRRLTRDEVEERYGTTGAFRFPLGMSRYSGVWILLVLLIVALALVGGLPGGGGGEGVNLREVLKPFPAAPAHDGRSFGDRDSPGFVGRVARDVDQTWRELFRRAGIAYRSPTRVVFDGMGRSDCGITLAAGSDQFYCEYDEKLMLDSGVAYSYQVAHAYAHHVQFVLGITPHIRRAEEADRDRAREFWLRHELQADCLAGVWAYSAYRKLDVADAVGPAPSAVDPDHQVDRKHWSATTPEQRTKWFRNGLRDGKPAACDTFSRDV
jgi:predicted metalloprotease